MRAILQRFGPLLISGFLALGLTWLWSPTKLLLPEAPFLANAAMFALASGGCFLVLLPLWLPAAVTVATGSASQVVLFTCGWLLLALSISLLLAVVILGGSPGFWAPVAATSLTFGVMHLVSRRKVSASQQKGSATHGT